VLPAAAAAPAIFTLNATGSGPGAILNQDYTVNSYSNPADPGSIVMVYGTGLGALIPLPIDGKIADAAADSALPVTASVAGVPATVMYAGAAPGLIAGVVQVNVQIPGVAASNPAAPISLSVGAAVSAPGVTVAIR
jgi:uncharacterized protein (TIGR03437 family)